jgi:hypothetical protein
MNMRSMTNQELFDKVYLGIIQQGGPSIDFDTEKCLYRGPNGRKCAAGQVLLDQYYNKDMEGVIIGYGDFIDNGLISSGLSPNNINFLKLLQSVHDNSASNATYSDQDKDKFFLETFKNAMESLAQEYNLVVPTI